MDRHTQTNELNLRNIISSIFRQKLIIIILSPPIIIGVFIALLFQTHVYEAKVKMFIVGEHKITTDYYSDIRGGGVQQTQMEIVKSDSVLRRAVIAAKLDKRPLDYEKFFCYPVKNIFIDYKVNKIKDKFKDLTPEQMREAYINYAINELKENLSTTPIPGTDLFVITIKAFSAEDAIAIANIVSRSYIIFDLQQQFAELTQKYGLQHPSVQQLRDNIFSMTEKLSGEKLPDLEAIGTASVKVIDQATSTKEPIGQSKMVILLIAIAVSICVSISIAVMYDIFMDQTFKSPSEIVKFSGLPLLGSVPIRRYSDEILVNTDKFNTSKSELNYSNFFEDLADQLFIYMKVNKLKTILITSAFPKGGASTISANIGITLGEKMNAKTMVIDANFRHPVMHKLFDLKEGPGFANFLEEGKLIEYHNYSKQETENLDNSLPITDKSENVLKISKNVHKRSALEIDSMIHHIDSKLSILQAGKTSMAPITLFTENKLDMLFKLKKAQYDAIIIDCPNLRDYKDAGILSSHVDGVALVVNDGKEKRQIVMNSISYIKQKKGNPFGLILNKRRFPIPEFIYRLI
jgi:Mrp family chromosome partitioning ATPase/capsular polysaccharide biosynthesis protein